MSKSKKKGLGIDALLGKINPNISQESVQNLSNTIAQIPLENIEVNPFQPRVDFDELALNELAQSIKVHGLIQPITVRHLHSNKFQLISGERRLRASKLAGLKEVPAFVRLANDQEMLEMALIENIQREELNAVEVAYTYQRLMEECKLTHIQLSERLGKGRTTITNYVRLLKLPPEIQTGIRDGKISMGHARALININDFAVQMSVYNEIIERQLSVRQTEELAAQYKEPKEKKAAKGSKLPEEHQRVLDRLCTHFESKVQMKRNGEGKGALTINFDSDEDLNRILDILQL